MSEKRVIATVISTLEKLACKFKSASDLIEAIKKYGLFEGRAQLEDGKWHLLNAKRFHKPTSWATYGTFPSFVSLTKDGTWYCCLGYEDRLILGFREDGELVHVEPDLHPSECWEEYEDAVDEVLNLCNIIWFPFSRKPLFQ
jgi:hypothetical protein